MFDQHEAHDGPQDLGQHKEHRDAVGDRPQAARPLADREVPLPGSTAATDGAALVINHWLDGDVTEADAHRADSKQVDMWKLVTAETDRRKRITTPAHVAANIMAALPEKQTQTLATPATVTAEMSNVETERGLSVNMAAAIGAGLFAIGLAIGKLVL